MGVVLTSKINSLVAQISQTKAITADNLLKHVPMPRGKSGGLDAGIKKMKIQLGKLKRQARA